MDSIYIRDLRVEAIVGVYAWEQRIRRPLRLDIEFSLDTRKAAASGNIADTCDYEAMAETVRRIASQAPWTLLEELAETIAQELLARFPGESVHITLGKPGAIAGAGEVGLRIQRQHTPTPPPEAL